MDVVASGKDRSGEPAFQQARRGQPWFGPVYFRKETEPYMTISRPAGSGGGVTVAEVNLKFVWEVVSRIHIGQAGLAFAVDASGTLIAHPDISLVLKQTSLAELPQVAASLQAQAGTAPTIRRAIEPDSAQSRPGSSAGAMRDDARDLAGCEMAGGQIGLSAGLPNSQPWPSVMPRPLTAAAASSVSTISAITLTPRSWQRAATCLITRASRGSVFRFRTYRPSIFTKSTTRRLR